MKILRCKEISKHMGEDHRLNSQDFGLQLVQRVRERALSFRRKMPKEMTFGAVVRLCFRCSDCWRPIVTQTLVPLGVSDSPGSLTSGPSSWLPLVSPGPTLWACA